MGIEEKVGELSEGKKRKVWDRFLQRRVTPHVMEALIDITSDIEDLKISGRELRQAYFKFMEEQKAEPWSEETINAFLKFIETLKREYYNITSNYYRENADMWDLITSATTRHVGLATENARRGYLFYNAYVNSNYLRGKPGRHLTLPAITASLDFLLDHEPRIDSVVLGAVLSAEKANDL